MVIYLLGYACIMLMMISLFLVASGYVLFAANDDSKALLFELAEYVTCAGVIFGMAFAVSMFMLATNYGV